MRTQRGSGSLQLPACSWGCPPVHSWSCPRQVHSVRYRNWPSVQTPPSVFLNFFFQFLVSWSGLPAAAGCSACPWCVGASGPQVQLACPSEEETYHPPPAPPLLAGRQYSLLLSLRLCPLPQPSSPNRQSLASPGREAAACLVSTSITDSISGG